VRPDHPDRTVSIPTTLTLSAYGDILDLYGTTTSGGLAPVRPSHPVRTSDHVKIREFRSTDVWHHQHGFCDGRYPLGFVVSSRPTEFQCIGMHRSHRDLNDDEMTALTPCSTLLAAALPFRSGPDAAAAHLQHLSLPRGEDDEAGGAAPTGTDRRGAKRKCSP
jgi:hypothetical protein